MEGSAKAWFNWAPDIYLSYEELTEEYPRYPDIFDVTRSEQIDHNMVLNVEKYMNPCPYTVFPNTPVPQVFNLFRSMGLRHLPVVSHEGQVVGMITRHNLTHEYLEMCFHDMASPNHAPDQVPDHVGRSVKQ
ncbi:hypothetical protein KUTeg_001221 [Tegillarca granosa]|uniref:CBS domain-containing protein n=1 Tax=Tegillarca granosa TaxID=220873 RepID=A0ABQ9FWS2_TEGGR|nr:hypothetical protein KUTeg_001221 [Tegillarca granosa]